MSRPNSCVITKFAVIALIFLSFAPQRSAFDLLINGG